MKTLEERFWSKVDKRGPDDCWEWNANKNTAAGYGRFRVNGKLELAHRASWEIHNGLIPEGEGHHGTCVLHRCDFRSCVNPRHLFLGTNQDNMDDMKKKGRNHQNQGESHPMSKLTEKTVRMIRKYFDAGGCSHDWLAQVYGVDKSNIGLIVRRQTWRHIA